MKIHTPSAPRNLTGLLFTAKEIRVQSRGKLNLIWRMDEGIEAYCSFKRRDYTFFPLMPTFGGVAV